MTKTPATDFFQIREFLPEKLQNWGFFSSLKIKKNQCFLISTFYLVNIAKKIRKLGKMTKTPATEFFPQDREFFA